MSPSPDQRSSVARVTCGPVNTEQSEFSREERKLLLKLAHEAIVASLEHRELSLSPVLPHLTEPRGAFTTLYFRGELRGCVGHVYPIDSLYRTVAETARAAAFEDTRFWPITLDEASGPGGSWKTRAAGEPSPASWLAATASAHRAWMGSCHLPGADLPQGRFAPRCVADRRANRSFYRGSLRGPGRGLIRHGGKAEWDV